MSVKKKTYRRGPFVHTKTDVRFDGENQTDEFAALMEILEAATPKGRIAKWKPHAERLQVGLDDLYAAEDLIDDHGTVSNMDRFDLCLTRAVEAIEIAQAEKTIVPEAQARQRQLHAPRNKKNKALLKYCQELMQKKCSTSAAHLRSRFPFREAPAIVDGNQIFQETTEGEEKIFIIKPNGKQAPSVGQRAFSEYWKHLNKKLER